MEKPSTVLIPHTLDPGGHASPVARALPIVFAGVRQQACYATLLNRDVFDLVPLANRKEDASYRKTLVSPATLPILAIIWKESPSVSEADLVRNDLARTFGPGDPINCHALASEIVDDPKEFAKAQKRIKSIAVAGEAFGLVERRKLPGTTAVQLHGTSRLNGLMVALSDEWRVVLGEALGSVPEKI